MEKFLKTGKDIDVLNEIDFICKIFISLLLLS